MKHPHFSFYSRTIVWRQHPALVNIGSWLLPSLSKTFLFSPLPLLTHPGAAAAPTQQAPFLSIKSLCQCVLKSCAFVVHFAVLPFFQKADPVCLTQFLLFAISTASFLGYFSSPFHLFALCDCNLALQFLECIPQESANGDRYVLPLAHWPTMTRSIFLLSCALKLMKCLCFYHFSPWKMGLGCMWAKCEHHKTV